MDYVINFELSQGKREVKAIITDFIGRIIKQWIQTFPARPRPNNVFHTLNQENEPLSPPNKK